MKVENLRSLIRESINEYIREIDNAGTKAGLEAKIAATEGAIEKREKMANMEGIDEAYHEMLDKGKMKEIGNEVKALKKSLTKLQNQLSKLNSKSEPKAEVIKDEPVEEADKYNPENNWNDAEVDDPFNAGQTKHQPMDEVDLSDKEKEELRKKAETNDKEYNIMNESFLKMQKLAGVITESQYNEKVKSLNEKMSYDDFELMVKPFLDLAKTKGWVWNGSGDSWFDITSPAIALYHSTELPTTADGEYKGQKMLASKDVTIGNQIQTYRGNIEKKQGDVIMQPDYDMNQVYFQSKDKAILDAIKTSMANNTEVVQDAKELSSQLTSGNNFEPVKYYSILLRKKA